MSVIGGRRVMGVRKGLSLGSAVGLTLLCAVGCGGRTSTLDPNVYSDDVSADDDDVIVPGTGGKPSTGGKPGVNVPSTGGTGIATAGRPGIGGTSAYGGAPASGGAAPAGGSFGTAGSPAVGGTGPGMPGATASACIDYCSGYQRTCVKELEGRDCFSLCASEVDGFGPTCQQLGVKALRCLTPHFQNASLSCSEAEATGLGKCATAVSRFQECKTKVTPPPPPPPPPPPCGSSSYGDQYSCSLTSMCIDGSYSVDCKSRGDGVFDCYCYWPNGFNNTVTLAGVATSACSNAAAYCGLPL